MNLNNNVIHVVSSERAVNYKWEKDYNKISPNVEIVSIDEIRNLPQVYKERFKVDHFEEGMVFILDKINKEYVLAEKADDYLEESKNNAIDYIASLLGAKKIHRKTTSIKYSKREINGDGEIKTIWVDASASCKKVTERNESKKYDGIAEFPGNYTRKGYEMAKKYAEETGLDKDRSVRDMLRYRSPDNPNPKSHEKHELELSAECNDCMEFAFSLNILKGIFELSGSVSEAISNIRRIDLSLEIEYESVLKE